MIRPSMADNGAENDTIARSPYTSGGSKVMTVSGIPPLQTTDKIITKRVKLNGSECVICLPYEEFSEYEVKNMGNEIKIDEK
jgi:hypothetical protein